MTYCSSEIQDMRKCVSSASVNILSKRGIVLMNICNFAQANSEKGSIMETLSQKQAKEKELTDQWTERWSETHTILQEQKTLGLRKAGVQ